MNFPVGEAAWRNKIINIEMATAFCENMPKVIESLGCSAMEAAMLLVLAVETKPDDIETALTSTELAERMKEYLIKGGYKFKDKAFELLVNSSRLGDALKQLEGYIPNAGKED